MRFLSLALLLAFASSTPAARAEDGCERRRAALRVLFAAAAAAPEAELRAPLESALVAASADYAERGCAPLELAVDELWIHAGETRVVPGGTRILAANGAAILGRLVARGEGGVAIVVTLGDLVLEGAIEARTVALEARSGNVRVGSRFAVLSDAKVRAAADAGAILFAPRETDAPNPFPPGAELLSFHSAAPPCSPYPHSAVGWRPSGPGPCR